ncbi:MAG: response regulator transcription factor [Acidobacteriota bacterium]|nr:response regulator transcription factor [Acidobacteriota bacterium]
MPKTYPSSGAQRVKAAEAQEGIRVLLSDVHALVRAGIRVLLERMKEVEVIAEAAGGQDTLELIEKLSPDLVLLDITERGLSGLDVLKQIVGKFPGLRVIVLTAANESEQYAVHVLRLGATGFVPKDAASTELEMAIKAVAAGENYLSAEISKQSILKYLKDPDAFVSALTPRQYEVLKLIAEGHTTKEIARRLDISVKTVETHRAQIMERLNIRDVAGLVRYALWVGLVKLDE